MYLSEGRGDSACMLAGCSPTVFASRQPINELLVIGGLNQEEGETKPVYKGRIEVYLYKCIALNPLFPCHLQLKNSKAAA